MTDYGELHDDSIECWEDVTENEDYTQWALDEEDRDENNWDMDYTSERQLHELELLIDQLIASMKLTREAIEEAIQDKKEKHCVNIWQPTT